MANQAGCGLNAVGDSFLRDEASNGENGDFIVLAEGPCVEGEFLLIHAHVMHGQFVFGAAEAGESSFEFLADREHAIALFEQCLVVVFSPILDDNRHVKIRERP